MDEEEKEVIPEEDLTNKPLEVVIKNPPKDVRDKRYDSKDDPEYDDLGITQEELKEFEDGNT